MDKQIYGCVYIASNWMLSDEEFDVDKILNDKMTTIIDLLAKTCGYGGLYFDINWLTRTAMSHVINIYGSIPDIKTFQYLKSLIDEHFIDVNLDVESYCFEVKDIGVYKECVRKNAKILLKNHIISTQKQKIDLSQI